jgi:hypothetical protein
MCNKERGEKTCWATMCLHTQLFPSRTTLLLHSLTYYQSININNNRSNEIFKNDSFPHMCVNKEHVLQNY